MSPSLWLVVIAAVLVAVVADVVADRPCADCGRWLRHTLICRRRVL